MNNIKKGFVWSLVFLSLYATMPINALAYTKDETVYTKLNGNGDINKVIVTEHILNNEKTNVINDYTELKDIINLSDSNYEHNNDLLKWNALGKDVYYEGTTDKKMPISINISYKLNGNEIGLDELLGKSGNVEISFKYTNNDMHKMLVNGKYKNLYTPFVVTMGTVLDNEVKDISVNNGKVSSNGSKNIVLGIALPGMYESTGITSLKDKDQIRLSFTTDNFKLPTVYSFVNSKLFNTDDLDVFDKMDNLYDASSKLKGGIDEISKGAEKVSAGSSLLKQKLGGVSLPNTQNTLTEEQLAGIAALSKNKIAMSYTDEYKNGIANKAWDTVKKNMGSDVDVANIAKNNATEMVVSYLKAADLYDDYVACETGKIYKEKTGTMTAEQQNSCMVIANDKVLPSITEAATKLFTDTATKISLTVAEKVTKQVAPMVSEQTALQVGDNVSKQVASTVADETLKAALNNISSSLKELYNGVSALDDGITSLKDGINKYNEEGITKLDNMVNGEVKDKISTLEKLSELSESYNFTNATSSKMVLVLEGRKLDTKANVSNNTVVKTNLWTKFINLFK